MAADDGSGEDLGKLHLLNDSYPDNYYYFDIDMIFECLNQRVLQKR